MISIEGEEGLGTRLSEHFGPRKCFLEGPLVPTIVIMILYLFL